MDLRLAAPLVWPPSQHVAFGLAAFAVTVLTAFAAARLAPQQYFAPPPEEPSPGAPVLEASSALDWAESPPPEPPASA